MRLIKHLYDDQYEKQEITHTRNVVRAFCYNDKYEIAFIYLVREDDEFGKAEYYETPGGGVKKNETLIEALKREIKEELGAEIDNIEPIGRVVDYYNKINRCNNNHYFMCHIVSYGDNDLEDYEKRWFSKIVYLNVDKAISEIENEPVSPLSTLVKRRELPLLKIVKHRLAKRLA